MGYVSLQEGTFLVHFLASKYPKNPSPGTRFKGNLEIELGSQDREDLQAIQDWGGNGGFP